MRGVFFTPLLVLGLMSGSALAGGGKAGDIHLSYGDKGTSGQVYWGDEGIRMDFPYPVGGGRTERATLAIQQETGDAVLLLHGPKEALVGTWTLSQSPNPLDLIEPAIADREREEIGEVQLGKLRCKVSEDTSHGHLKVWAPLNHPTIPRLARKEGATEDTSMELSLSNVRPTHFKAEDLKIPVGFEVHPFSLQELFNLSSGAPTSGELGAEAILWMAKENLNSQLKEVEYALLIQSQEEAMVSGEATE